MQIFEVKRNFLILLEFVLFGIVIYKELLGEEWAFKKELIIQNS